MPQLGEGDEVELEHLFVHPAHLGRATAAPSSSTPAPWPGPAGARALTIRSDPHAAGFYRAMGATDTGPIPSSIPGRTIPTFRVALGG